MNGAPVPEEAVVEQIARWTPEVERLGATFFEATTCMAFEFFANASMSTSRSSKRGSAAASTRRTSSRRSSPASRRSASTTWSTSATPRRRSRSRRRGSSSPACRWSSASAIPRSARCSRGCAHEAGSGPVRVLDDESRLTGILVSPEGTRFTIASRGSQAHADDAAASGGIRQQNAAVAIAMLESAGGEWRAAAGEAERSTGGRAPAGPVPAVAQFHLRRRAQSRGSGGALRIARRGCAAASDWPACSACLTTRTGRRSCSALARHVDRFVLTTPPSVPAERAWPMAESPRYAAANAWAADHEPRFRPGARRGRARARGPRS